MSYSASGNLQTFVFADLAGFTALTEAHGDDHAAEVASSFCGRVAGAAEFADAEMIKSIGDAAMLRSANATAAVELGLSIIEEEGSRQGSPQVRVGMHTGPAVERGGDWFGSTVNVAARVGALAAAGEVVLTDATATQAGEKRDLELERLGSRELRNVGEPVVLYRARRSGSHAGPAHVDPVCRMTLADGEWVGSLLHEGRHHYFCSMECARKFTTAPERYDVV
jgi:class 3 adenylate cyclase/YHS domain-containing protein